MMVTSVAVRVPVPGLGLALEPAPEFALTFEPVDPLEVCTVTVLPVARSVLEPEIWLWYAVDEPVAIVTVSPLASLTVNESAETLTTVPAIEAVPEPNPPLPSGLKLPRLPGMPLALGPNWPPLAAPLPFCPVVPVPPGVATRPTAKPMPPK